MKNYTHLFIFIILLIVLSSSCNKRNLYYITDKYDNELKNKTEFSNQPPDYKIQAYDRLQVQIISTNDEVNKLFNRQSIGNQNQNQGGYNHGYMVSDTGTVQLPVLGIINVEGKTIIEIQKLLQDKTDLYIKDALINVRLISFTIYFLGETSTQGAITFYEPHVSLIKAMSVSGGINDYGNKQKLMILRQTPTGYKIFHVDITDRNILEADNFYLQPNDLIYAEPLPSKIIRKAISDYSLAISILTTTLSTAALILNVLK